MPTGPAQHEIHLPGFVIDEPTGLGDVIQRATSAVGITPCGGCVRRAERLNRWITFVSGRTTPEQPSNGGEES